MKLYFVRHGKAVDASLMPNDFDRPLTDKGAKKVRKIANVLHGMGIAPSAIFASPRVRAQQTALIIAETLHKTVTTREEVNFDFSVHDVEKLVTGYPNDAEIMFVGHNPSMSQVVRDVVGANMNMDVGAVVCALVTPYSVRDGELAWAMNWHVVKAIEE
jgi:phosphohistidine phosphatase